MKNVFTSRPALAVYAILLLLTADRGSANLTGSSDSVDSWTIVTRSNLPKVAVKRKAQAHATLGGAFSGYGSDTESNGRVFVTTPGTSDDLSFLYQAEFVDNSSAGGEF